MPFSVSELRERLGLLRIACDEVGRDYSELQISVELQIIIGSDQSSIRDQLRGMLDLAPDEVAAAFDPDVRAFAEGQTDAIPESLRRTTLIGTPGEVRQQLQAYVDEGPDHFLLWFLDAPVEDGMRLFADQVAPAFREVGG
jgi:alkanesulfonate monooxygenase SsuD/methylene tetrahydromethanopterin reductase-like flavin-dependent oxidoreductase (luciferase family)